MKKDTSPSLEFKKLEVLFRLKASIYLGSFISAIAVALIFLKDVKFYYHYLWLGVHFSYLLLRLGSSLYFLKNKDRARTKPKTYKNLYFFVSLYGGLGWGIASVFYLDGQSTEKFVLFTALIAGNVAASLASNSASQRASMGYILCNLLPFGYAIFNSNLIYRYEFITLFALFIFVCFQCTKYIYNTINRAIQYQLSSEKLLIDLNSSKELATIAKNKALESTRMASIGELASGFAHEINNPLTVINGNLYILRRKLKDKVHDPSIDKAIRKSFENIRRITQLIDSLKTVSIADDPNSEHSDEALLKDVIENATALMIEKLKINQIRLEVDITNPFSRVPKGDKAATQIIISLITNSYKLISKTPDPWISIKSFQGSDFIQIEISSSDTSLSEEVVYQFLDPFYIPNESDPEFGIIISLANSQADSFGHKLRFKRHAQYSCFTLKLAI
ncbi:sensor histidine kinase [Bacteriovorax sp. DB6_IX]|uniref:sensor histidine kinase n=1 Tax=Bacteriovorax sp. DB6_IX TaxID=1353530 RepID=UPI00038A35A7|nr:HAMP domain-containing sensor histidine kinase [Bacteriovorax sp. DB6_IX]EQC51987.1 histidine kinase A domain protein [Bacteriovorax sp. DB6_IX]